MWCTQSTTSLVDTLPEPKAPEGKGLSFAQPCGPKILSQSFPALGSQVGLGARHDSTRYTYTVGSDKVSRLPCGKLTAAAGLMEGI